MELKVRPALLNAIEQGEWTFQLPAGEFLKRCVEREREEAEEAGDRMVVVLCDGKRRFLVEVDEVDIGRAGAIHRERYDEYVFQISGWGEIK
jgi:hypothetical protein